MTIDAHELDPLDLARQVAMAAANQTPKLRERMLEASRAIIRDALDPAFDFELEVEQAGHQGEPVVDLLVWRYKTIQWRSNGEVPHVEYARGETGTVSG